MHTTSRGLPSRAPRRGRSTAGTDPRPAEVHRVDVGPDRPDRPRGGPSRADGRTTATIPPAATSWSASTARRSGSARSGGRPRRRPGAAQPCGSCTRPPTSVPASTAGAPSPELPRARGITAVAYTVARHTEPGVAVVDRGRAGRSRHEPARAPRRPASCSSWAARPPGPPTRWCWPRSRPRVAARSPVAGRRRPPPPWAGDRRTARGGDPRRRRPGRRRGGRRVRGRAPRSGSASRSRCCRPAAAQRNVAASWVDDPDEWAQRFADLEVTTSDAAGRPGEPSARRRLPVAAPGDQHRPRHPAAPLAGRPAPLAAAALHARRWRWCPTVHRSERDAGEEAGRRLTPRRRHRPRPGTGQDRRSWVPPWSTSARGWPSSSSP